jgi:hypothetical protein
LGGYLKHLQFNGAVFNSSRYLAECKDCAAMFPGVSGTWLDPVYINGQRTLATGAVQPSYFFEELVIGNGIGKLASGIVGMIKGVGFAARGGNFAEKLFLSERFGITSERFGSSIAKAQGSLNQPGGLFKIGWSNVARNGGGMQMRIGIGARAANSNQSLFHVYIPKTFVSNNFSNPSIQVKLSLNKLGL